MQLCSTTYNFWRIIYWTARSDSKMVGRDADNLDEADKEVIVDKYTFEMDDQTESTGE